MQLEGHYFAGGGRGLCFVRIIRQVVVIAQYFFLALILGLLFTGRPFLFLLLSAKKFIQIVCLFALLLCLFIHAAKIFDLLY